MNQILCFVFFVKSVHNDDTKYSSKNDENAGFGNLAGQEVGVMVAYFAGSCQQYDDSDYEQGFHKVVQIFETGYQSYSTMPLYKTSVGA